VEALTTRKKVAVGLSGGVDSAVAAYLLKEQGYEVTGVYLQCWERKADGCESDKDKIFAIRNAKHLNIPFLHLDFISEYKSRVIEYFYSEYQAGRTPNPDVMCNKEIKFGLFFDWAMKEGFDFVSTGHYARVDSSGDSVKLLKGVDSSKDQSYFLYLLDQSHLRKSLFPVGGMKKTEIRKIAEENNVPSSKRPDSMGICFIGEVDIKKFLAERIESKKGVVKNINGEVIGEHEGVWFYTIGQRHGFTVTKYTGTPMYVVSKNVDENILIVGNEEDALSDSFEISNIHWISGESPKFPLDCDVRIRHLGKLYSATINKTVGDNFSVSLNEKAFGVSPGQSAVVYIEDELLGGGIIL
jgi:tRNA-specific 2-thiouridylase